MPGKVSAPLPADTVRSWLCRPLCELPHPWSRMGQHNLPGPSHNLSHFGPEMPVLTILSASPSTYFRASFWTHCHQLPVGSSCLLTLSQALEIFMFRLWSCLVLFPLPHSQDSL